MAKTVITSLVDDLDTTPASETVRFALDGTNYEIDLNEGNAARLREGLAPFVSAARSVGSAGKTVRVRRTVIMPEQRVIRDWAAGQGITLNRRGRIPQAVVEQYMATAGA